MIFPSFFLVLPFLISIEARQAARQAAYKMSPLTRFTWEGGHLWLDWQIETACGDQGGRWGREMTVFWFGGSSVPPLLSFLLCYVWDAAPQWMRGNFKVPAEERWAAQICSAGERAYPAVTPRRHTLQLRFPSCLGRLKAILLNFLFLPTLQYA